MENLFAASLWRDAGQGVCVAPASYRGGCGQLVDTNGMFEKDKLEFGMRCGARLLPPLNGMSAPNVCASQVATAAHRYADVCPEGWRLEVRT